MDTPSERSERSGESSRAASQSPSDPAHPDYYHHINHSIYQRCLVAPNHLAAAYGDGGEASLWPMCVWAYLYPSVVDPQESADGRREFVRWWEDVYLDICELCVSLHPPWRGA